MSVKKLFECVECKETFSALDVRRGKFFVSTLVCEACYWLMKNGPYELSCFGKETVVRGNKTFYGYDPDARECRRECPDRYICRVFVKL